MLACALIPRFELVSALAGRREMMTRPVAIAPDPGAAQVIGDVSGAAEAFGVVRGMGLGEALGRCPSLGLVPADPQRAEDAWENSLVTLEGIGAAVESRRAGEAFFGLDGLRALWGRPERALERARRLLGQGVRLGAGPTRLCALAAALRSRPRRGRGTTVIPESETKEFLAGLEIGILRDRIGEAPDLVATLERLGVTTLGELAALPTSAVADRFGAPGLRGQGMARGTEEPIRPRIPRIALREEIELFDGATSGQLDQAMGLLVDRLLASPHRRGRSFRRLRIEARLAAGGGWRIEAVTRQASADRERLLMLLRPKLGALPAPASRLALRALEMGEAPARQAALYDDGSAERRGRVNEAVRQARAAAGRGAVMRVLEVDPGSDVPERWVTLAPYVPPGEPE